MAKKKKMDPRTSIRRLRLLADRLMRVPKERFDYGVWVGDDWEGKPDLSCGTTACALGWATTVPQLNRLGLELKRLGSKWNGGGMVVLRREGRTVCSDPFEAGARVFGLTEDEARYLFGPEERSPFIEADDLYTLDDDDLAPERGATAKDVARHIRKFIKRRWPNVRRA